MKISLLHFLIQNKLFIIGGLLFYYLITTLKLKIQFKRSKLEALGFWENQTQPDHTIKKIPPKGYFSTQKGCLVFTKYNPTVISKIESPDFINSLSAIYNKKFTLGQVEHKSFFKMFGQAELKFYYENLPTNLKFKDIPKTAGYPNVWFGRNTKNQDILINLENCHGILCLGRAGSGKSQIARSILGQFPEHQKIIIDDKGTDYLDLKIKHFYNPTDLEEFKTAIELIEEYLKECEEYKLKLKRNGIQVSHWNQLKDRPHPKIILLDEMSQYMKLNKTGDKEKEQLKNRLITAIEKLLQLYRVSGTVIVGMSQSSNASDYDISFNNFSVRIYSKQNAQQSVNLVGSHILNDQDLFSGVFYLTSPKTEEKFKAPFYPLEGNTTNQSQINNSSAKANRKSEMFGHKRADENNSGNMNQSEREL